MAEFVPESPSADVGPDSPRSPDWQHIPWFSPAARLCPDCGLPSVWASYFEADGRHMSCGVVKAKITKLNLKMAARAMGPASPLGDSGKASK